MSLDYYSHPVKLVNEVAAAIYPVLAKGCKKEWGELKSRTRNEYKKAAGEALTYLAKKRKANLIKYQRMRDEKT